MCGRYTLRRPGLLSKLGYQKGFEEFSEIRIEPRFNIAPSQQITTIRHDKDGEPKLGSFEWGLIAHWQKLRPKRPPNCARDDTVATSGMFRQAFVRRRCLIPADGFYEWQVLADGKTKQPYFIRFTDDRIYSFAAIWELWSDGHGHSVDTAALITTSPNDMMRPIHNRMPVILNSDEESRWLNPETSTDEIQRLLKPYPDNGDLEAYPVSPAMNKPSNESSHNIDRVSPPVTLFG